MRSFISSKIRSRKRTRALLFLLVNFPSPTKITIKQQTKNKYFKRKTQFQANQLGSNSIPGKLGLREGSYYLQFRELNLGDLDFNLRRAVTCVILIFDATRFNEWLWRHNLYGIEIVWLRWYVRENAIQLEDLNALALCLYWRIYRRY